jgi:hypothetical protein
VTEMEDWLANRITYRRKAGISSCLVSSFGQSVSIPNLVITGLSQLKPGQQRRGGGCRIFLNRNYRYQRNTSVISTQRSNGCVYIYW